MEENEAGKKYERQLEGRIQKLGEEIFAEVRAICSRGDDGDPPSSQQRPRRGKYRPEGKFEQAEKELMGRTVGSGDYYLRAQKYSNNYLNEWEEFHDSCFLLLASLAWDTLFSLENYLKKFKTFQQTPVRVSMNV